MDGGSGIPISVGVAILYGQDIWSVCRLADFEDVFARRGSPLAGGSSDCGEGSLLVRLKAALVAFVSKSSTMLKGCVPKLCRRYHMIAKWNLDLTWNYVTSTYEQLS